MRLSAIVGYLGALGAVLVVSAAIAAVPQAAGIPNVSMLYLIPVLAAATLSGRGPSILASVSAFVAFDILFVAPRYTLLVTDPSEWIALLLLLATAVITSELASGQRGKADVALLREREATVLYDVARLTGGPDLGAALQVRRSQRVLLIDADTVTGHVASSLGLDQVRSVVDSWRDEADDGVREGLLEIASAHSSGMRVVTLTSTPLHTEVLTGQRVTEAIGAVRRSFDFIIIDTHPSYGPLNLALFEHADRILVPLTPDLPALRAAVQFRDVAAELGIQDRISMIVNRANSGVSVADIERTVGIPALAQIRSAGMLFVRAANEGRTVIERFPREKVTEDFDRLADRLLPAARNSATQSRPVVRGLFGRREVPAGV